MIDKRLRKTHKDILLNHNYKPENWWLLSENDNLFTIKHKEKYSVRKFSKLDKSEIIIREVIRCNS